MPYRQEVPHLGVTGNPDTFNVATLPYPGQAGNTFQWNGNTYTIVQLDPGATPPIIGQVMFWMTKTGLTPQVTNVVANAVNGATTNAWRNEVAGIIRNIATAGNWICMLIQGSNIPVLITGVSPGIGDMAVANVAASVGVALNIAAGTAPTYQTIGVFRSTFTGNLANCDVNIENLL
ncbi:MAG TPA: hypothetical protein VKQ11_00475 [Candidatus Sulfotelmatobacter sp.]|nr:hypothetical protein [Candidatus Sulfotelmatobacter sp.]